jgi:PPOX class probable F420-dependent enzyme
MSVQIPDSHKDLFERPVVVSLATVNRDGQPQVTPIWCDYDGTYIRINTARGRLKDKNMHERPQVTVLAIDPDDPYRWIEVRGTIEEETEEGGVDHINSLSRKYRGVLDYYSRNPSKRGKETRVIYKMRPTHITKDG